MTKTQIILKKLHHVALTTAEIIEGLIPGYSDSYKAMRGKISGYVYPQQLSPQQWKRQQERIFYTLLSRLKEHELVKKQGIGPKSLWKITKKGIENLEKIKIDPTRNFPKENYSKSLDEFLNIVVFDIPEKFKCKRVWLRQQLKKLDFVMLQRSVWIGKYKIPEELIYDLETLELFAYIHILKVHKTGSLLNLEL